jgi:uncharacterized protein (TIGR00252 family)
MTSFSKGKQAEQEATTFLTRKGYKVIAQNWRTRLCEIDIVAQKDGIVYFVEVQYRRISHQGSGLEYITPTKLRQMKFGAEMWIAEHDWVGDYRLAAIEVGSDQFKVTSFIDSL